MIKTILFSIGVVLSLHSVKAEEALLERAGFILDVDRSRNLLVIGASPADSSGRPVAMRDDTMIFSEEPTQLSDIFQGTSLEVKGPVGNNRITATRITALDVVPEEGRYKNRVIGVLDREDDKLNLLVNQTQYTLKVSSQTTILLHQKVTLGRLRKGQEVRMMVQRNEAGMLEARQIIFYPSQEEKTEKEEVLL